MAQQGPAKLFGPEHAKTYDKQFEKLAPFRDALQLAVRTAFRPAPPDARALIVGAGTGAELLTLADAYPGWRFTIVEPAPAMLAICRARAAERGLADRCVFHEGYVETLDPAPVHDVATALLVSQFVLGPTARRAFFQAIGDRLVDRGLLATADLATDGAPDGAGEDPLMALWGEVMRYNGMTEQDWRRYQETVSAGVAVRAPAEIETLIAKAGFDAPVRAYQAMLMHGWIARKATDR